MFLVISFQYLTPVRPSETEHEAVLDTSSRRGGYFECSGTFLQEAVKRTSFLIFCSETVPQASELS